MRFFREYVVTWAKMQRPFIEARGYTAMAERLMELIEEGGGPDAEARVQAGGQLLEGKLWKEALEAVPDEYIDEGWLVGPVERIRRKVEPWLDCGLTGLVIRYGPQLSHEPVVENLDVFTAIAQAADKEPRGK